MSTPMIEQVLALLPEDGRRVPYGEAIYRIRQRFHIHGAQYLAELGSSGRAVVETIDGWQWVRRVLVVVDFPLRARPYIPAARLPRRRPMLPPVASAARRSRPQGPASRSAA